MTYMVDETELAGSSILNYVWGLRTYMKHNRQLDPAFGVSEWDDWCHAVSVVAWVQGEPRRMVPLSLIRDSLRKVDLDNFQEVQAANLMLMLLFSFARSETPCPKTVDGFDSDQHLQVKDVLPQGGPRFKLMLRLKRIKQDQRIERPEAREGDWIWLGDTPSDTLFSVKAWTHRLFALHGAARDADSPFFVAPANRSHPLTYDSGMRHVRALWAKASSAEESKRYGLHGLRVTGYTLAKRGAGDTLAVAHGGWKSDAHERYERFSASQVLALPAAMLAAGAADAEGASALPVAPVVPAAPVAQSPAVPISVPVRPMRPSPTPARGRARGGSAQRQQAAAAVEAPSSSSGRPPRPLSYEHAAGRRVLVPSSLWPRYACTEHGGEGWEGLISKVRTTRVDQAQQALVDFVDRRRSGAGWQPVWLPLDSLRPLV
jgi:hypothetical protein